MKTIGLIGGMSWESTVPYYQIINNEVKKRIGGLHSAKVILYSVEFDEIEKCQSNGDWEKSGDILGGCSTRLRSCRSRLHSDLHKYNAQSSSSNPINDTYPYHTYSRCHGTRA